MVRKDFGSPPDFRTLYGLKWARSVEKRHGLPISEARRCSACANPFAYPAVEKFCRASSAGGRLNLQTNSFNRILSVAEDCLSPAGSFHGCSLMHGLKSGSYRFWQRIKFSLERYTDSVAHLFAYPAVGKFFQTSSAGLPTALAIKFSKPDRVGRRGLFSDA